MSFRARLFAAFAFAVLVPLALFAYGVRRQLDARLIAGDRERAAALVGVIHDDLDEARARIGSQLSQVAAELAASSRFRLAAIDGSEAERRWLLDYAGAAMRTRGLEMLQVQDDSGRILSSGHFRNEYDQVAPELPARLARLPDDGALARIRTAQGELLALTRIDSFEAGGHRFDVVGGVEADARFVQRLERDSSLQVDLVLPRQDAAGSGAPSGEPTGEIPVPYVDATMPGGDGTARFVIRQRGTGLAELRRDVTRWLLAAAGTTIALALGVAGWLASRVSRPLRDLAEKTEAIDLDRLDQDFTTDRDDEIGSLSRLLGAMTDRLGASTARLREAERRAVTGDLSRQITHDIKNGLAPIRHVLRHLSQVAQQEPGRLPTVFAERRETLESSVAYLETLARNYARLSPPRDSAPCDVNAIAREVARSIPSATAEFRLQLADELPPVAADPIAVRRILENLVGNGVDSLDGKPGVVTITTASAGVAARGVDIVVADTGHGMTREVLDRAFDDFFTTKDNGTGLGLSVVRRLVADLGGSLQVATEPGIGTRFVVHLPVERREAPVAGTSA